MSKGSGSPRNSGGRKESGSIERLQSRVDDLLSKKFDPNERGSITSYENDLNAAVEAAGKAYEKALSSATTPYERMNLTTANTGNRYLADENIKMYDGMQTIARSYKERLDRGEITKDEYDSAISSYIDRHRDTINKKMPFNK